MTLAQIMELALRQLDEEITDIDEFETLFKHYANEGYTIAQRKWLHPRETIMLFTDDNGCASIDGLGITRLIELHHENGWKVPYEVSPDGRKIRTRAKVQTLEALCEISFPVLKHAADEPKIPEYAHGALVDYICYRHLVNGSAGKQSRAQMYLLQFERAMREMSSESEGRVTQMTGLYEASDIRSVRW